MTILAKKEAYKIRCKNDFQSLKLIGACLSIVYISEWLKINMCFWFFKYQVFATIVCRISPNPKVEVCTIQYYIYVAIFSN
jgi:hypothetical protein